MLGDGASKNLTTAFHQCREGMNNEFIQGRVFVFESIRSPQLPIICSKLSLTSYSSFNPLGFDSSDGTILAS
jgi:hypothetical protein